MKTTLSLDAELMRAVKEHAKRHGLTVTRVVEDALRHALSESAPPAFQLELPVTHGRRMPTVDIDSNAGLEEYLDRVEREPAS